MYEVKPIPAPEEVIEREIEWCVQAARKSAENLWVAGYFAYRVVGLYQVDAVETIAQMAGRSTQSVRNWAHAYELYNHLRKSKVTFEIYANENGKEVKKTVNVQAMRRALTPTHFWEAWNSSRKWNMDEKRVGAHLFEMYKDGLLGTANSADVMSRGIEAEHERGGETPKWSYYIPRLTHTIQSVLVADGVPSEVRKAAQEFARVLARWQEAG